MTATLADYEWLTSDAATPYLARCEQHDGALTRLVQSLRKELSAERAHLVIEQVELRRRAREKFTRAPEMFFTRKGLEQATDEAIAAYKARRYPTKGVLLDVCCGIGGDLLSLGLHDDEPEAVYGLDADPIVALLARHNASVLLGGRVGVLTNAAEDVVMQHVGAWHVDPDRRATGKRATALEAFAPSRETLDGWAEANACGGIKVAPATEVDVKWQASAEREWIGSRGECRQQMVWFAGLARNVGQRSATVVDAGQPARTVTECSDAILVLQQRPLRYVFEAHAAVLAAKLSDSLAAEHGLLSLTTDGGYLTGDALIEDAALASFEVLDLLPFDIKQLKAYFRERNVGRLEIKKRGLDVDPERVRKQLGLRGDEGATLLLAGNGGCVVAVLAQRVSTKYQVLSR